MPMISRQCWRSRRSRFRTAPARAEGPVAGRPGALFAAEAAAGVQHHVALSIVGTDRTPDNGYFRAQGAPEKPIEASRIPCTIIRATQFLEFLSSIAASKNALAALCLHGSRAKCYTIFNINTGAVSTGHRARLRTDVRLRQ